MLSVGDLRKSIAELPDDAAVMVVYDGRMRHAAGVTISVQGSVAVLRSYINSRNTRKYTTAEDGLIGGLAEIGMTDEQISTLLDRPLHSIQRRKKALKLT